MKEKKAVFGGLGLPELGSGDVATITGLSQPTIRRMARDGSFPKPINLTGNTQRPVFRWFKQDVDIWMKDRMAGSGYQPYQPKHIEQRG